MSESLTKIVINCETKEETIVPLTAEEIAQREADSAAFAVAEAERIAAAEAAAEAKASGIAKLLALGLTEDEANALVK
jgi:TctA family transporter